MLLRLDFRLVETVLTFQLVVSRISLADVAGKGADYRARIVFAELEVVIDHRVFADLRLVLVLRTLVEDGRAARPAADHLGAEEIRPDADVAARVPHRLLELRHLLLQPADYQEGPVAQQRLLTFARVLADPLVGVARLGDVVPRRRLSLVPED